MGIAPNSTIQLFSGVPLNPSYNDTFYFVDRAAQESYFSNNTNSVKIFRENYRVEPTQSSIVISEKYEVIYNVNYMRFINLSYEGKWFYAFVTGVDYVNENATRITFQIDVMQTWLPDVDYDLRPCYVEREHASSDNIGDNIIEEGLCLGEYMFSDYKTLLDLSSIAIVIAVSKVNDNTVDGHIYDGLYGANELHLFKCNIDTMVTINEFLDDFVSDPDNITCIYSVPLKLFKAFEESDKEHIVIGGDDSYITTSHLAYIRDSKIALTDDFDGYTPLNNKLYTYPYTYYHVDDGCGNNLTLRYELFEDGQPELKVDCTLLSPVSVSIVPTGYKGLQGRTIGDGPSLSNSSPLYTEQIQTPPYPFCSWSVDTFKTWLSQNAISLAISGIKTVGGIASAVYMPMTAMAKTGKNAVKYAQLARQNAIGNSIESGVGNVLDNLNGLYRASIAADVCRGGSNNSSLAIATGALGLHTARAHITKEYCKTIDDFFTLYGYAVKKLKKPNIRARKYYTYTKTLDCKVYDAKLPKADSDVIEAIFNNGIRFWKSNITMGDYSQPNPPMQNEV